MSVVRIAPYRRVRRAHPSAAPYPKALAWFTALRCYQAAGMGYNTALAQANADHGWAPDQIPGTTRRKDEPRC